MSDSFTDNRKFRLLNIVDDFNRECLAIEADTSLPAQRVIRVLDRLILTKGKPANIRCDNGPEFISYALQAWCASHHITLQYIQPGSPTQNAYIERTNGSLRRELLDAYQFTSLREVKEMTKEWQQDYNHARPHASLGYLPPIPYEELWRMNQLSTNTLSTSTSGGRQKPQTKSIVGKDLMNECTITT